MAAPLVDVLIPAYNAERDIASSIRSIAAQTLRDIRIVVVDDGSTDRTGAIIADLAASDARIHALTRPNGGIVAALNDGLAACTAEFVARHDADDIAYPTRLADQIGFLRAHPDVVAVDGQYHHIDADGRRQELRDDPAGPVTNDPIGLPSKEPYLMHPFATFRRQAMQSVGGYRYAFHSEDTDLYWRLLERGGLYHMDRIVGEYRIHANSITSSSPRNGRISAAHSQLAAVSYRRRTAGRPDIAFPPDRLAAFQTADDLQPIIDLASHDLDEEEAAWLGAAVSAKLLELSLYRPYRLDEGDYRTIAHHLGLRRGGRRVSTPYVRSLRARCAFQLAREGRYGCARLLQPDPRMVARVVLKRVRARIGSRAGQAIAA